MSKIEMRYKIGDTARHGDVILTKIKQIPAGAIPVEMRPLAYGEVTGHSHRLQIDLGEAELFELEEKLFFRLKTSGLVVHDEHHPLPLDAGLWAVFIQREYHPSAPPRQVVD